MHAKVNLDGSVEVMADDQVDFERTLASVLKARTLANQPRTSVTQAANPTSEPNTGASGEVGEHKRGSQPVQPEPGKSIGEYAERVFHRKGPGAALSVREIYEDMVRVEGYHSDAKNPLDSLKTGIKRNKKFQLVAPGKWTFVGEATQKDLSLQP